MVDLEVTGVNDRPRRRADGECERVDNRVRDANGLDAERSDFDDVARPQSAQLDAVNGELFELVPEEAEGQGHSVDREWNALDEERQRADVVLVAMSQKHRLE